MLGQTLQQQWDNILCLLGAYFSFEHNGMLIRFEILPHLRISICFLSFEVGSNFSYKKETNNTKSITEFIIDAIGSSSNKNNITNC